MKPFRTDPIGREFYVPLGHAEIAANIFFYLTALLSIAVLIVPPQLLVIRQVAEIAFPTCSLGLFITSIAIRLYWAPRAHENRIADLLTYAFKVPMVDEPSVGYYNNTETDPIRRLNAAIMENAFFSKNLMRATITAERMLAGGYGIIWIVALLCRSTGLAIVAVVAQVLLSEQVLSRWLRIEFLYGRLERAYRTAHDLATMSLSAEQMRVRTMENLTLYEVWKAQAGVSVSSRMFEKLNSKLSAEWKQIGEKAGVLKTDLQ
jgi:hypothetical protein